MTRHEAEEVIRAVYSPVSDQDQLQFWLYKASDEDLHYHAEELCRPDYGPDDIGLLPPGVGV